METFDAAFLDSTGAFVISQLEKLDPTLNLPLQGYSWSRDLPVRDDFNIGYDFTSYLLGAFAAGGGVDPTYKSFVSKKSTTIPTVSTDLSKIPTQLFPWAEQTSYSIFELKNWMQLGQSIDSTQFEGVRRKYQQDADIMAYLGDVPTGSTGLLNNPSVTPVVVPTGATSGTVVWGTKTDTEILNDVNTLLYNTYAASGFTVYPDTLLLSPAASAYLTGRMVGTSGFQSIYNYIGANNISSQNNGRMLDIRTVKWLTGTSNGNPLGLRTTDSMVAYTKKYEYVRFPILPMQALPVQLRGLYQDVPYIAKMGSVEIPRPETIGVSYGMK